MPDSALTPEAIRAAVRDVLNERERETAQREYVATSFVTAFLGLAVAFGALALCLEAVTGMDLIRSPWFSFAAGLPAALALMWVWGRIGQAAPEEKQHEAGEGRDA